MSEHKVYIDGRKATSRELIAEMLGRSFDEDSYLENDERAVLYCGAKRIAILAELSQFLFAGLLISNGLWFTHWMGWI